MCQNDRLTVMINVFDLRLAMLRNLKGLHFSPSRVCVLRMETKCRCGVVISLKQSFIHLTYTSPPPVITTHRLTELRGGPDSTESVHNHEGGSQGIHTFTQCIGGGREDH